MCIRDRYMGMDEAQVPPEILRRLDFKREELEEGQAEEGQTSGGLIFIACIRMAVTDAPLQELNIQLKRPPDQNKKKGKNTGGKARRGKSKASSQKENIGFQPPPIRFPNLPLGDLGENFEKPEPIVHHPRPALGECSVNWGSGPKQSFQMRFSDL
eukprot:TRINITY_DN10922_c0_g1_i1.p1 TRINITY_DN10922_c0_g1~~TRINITY_DN10922_c0_g1_i1.p1  ORF type:complete len:156 (-),score=41.58 TRINITY_DN10922_c0_g1_i1:13-480(-)